MPTRSKITPKQAAKSALLFTAPTVPALIFLAFLARLLPTFFAQPYILPVIVAAVFGIGLVTVRWTYKSERTSAIVDAGIAMMFTFMTLNLLGSIVRPELVFVGFVAYGLIAFAIHGGRLPKK